MGLDSVELLMEIEDYFSIAIPNDEAANASTVGKMVNCVAKILNINKYDFTLRQNTFYVIKEQAQKYDLIIAPMVITGLVKSSFNVDDLDKIIQLEKATGLILPGIKRKLKDDNIIKRLKKWLDLVTIDFKTVPW